MLSTQDIPVLHDPDLDNSIVDVFSISIPDKFGRCWGAGIDIDSGEIVEWYGQQRPMACLKHALETQRDEDDKVYAIVNIMQEIKRYYPKKGENQ